MNTARSLTKGLERSIHLLRCTRVVSHSHKGFSTAKFDIIKNVPLARSSKLDTVLPRQFTQPWRSMSSNSKFEVINIQDEDDFKARVLEASCTVPIVVDFHATWCGPCKILGPRLEQLLSQENGKVLMAKVDIDDNPELAMEHGVQSVPTVVGIKNGQIQNKFIGVKDDDQICTFVDQLVAS